MPCSCILSFDFFSLTACGGSNQDDDTPSSSSLEEEKNITDISSAPENMPDPDEAPKPEAAPQPEENAEPALDESVDAIADSNEEEPILDAEENTEALPEDTSLDDIPPEPAEPPVMVYVSSRSHTVHSVPDCSGMKKYKEMTKTEADSKGYKYCTNCW